MLLSLFFFFFFRYFHFMPLLLRYAADAIYFSCHAHAGYDSSDIF